MFSAAFLKLRNHYQNVLFNDSSNESIGLLGKLFNLLLNSNNCSEGNILEFVFCVLVGDEYNMISIEDDSVALSI